MVVPGGLKFSNLQNNLDFSSVCYGFFLSFQILGFYSSTYKHRESEGKLEAGVSGSDEILIRTF